MENDSISRQAAIDAIWEHATKILESSDYDVFIQDFYKMAHRHIAELIKQLPSAHPELNEWCHDCKEYDTEKGCCPRWGQVIRTALEDAQPEIIRCKDCIYFDKGYDEETADWCHAWSETTSEDGYCHNAERGEEKE